MQCYFSQKIKDASGNVSDAIYNCGWENLTDLKLKRDIILPLSRAQNAAKVSTYLNEISLKHFEGVSYDFFLT